MTGLQLVSLVLSVVGAIVDVLVVVLVFGWARRLLAATEGAARAARETAESVREIRASVRQITSP